jgi:hypothetical protein
MYQFGQWRKGRIGSIAVPPHPLHGLQSIGPIVTSLAEFKRLLLASDTATAVIIDWCRRVRPGALFVAVLFDREARPGEYDGPLAIGVDETLHRRCVRLSWAGKVVSEAENWYVPQRLPADVLAVLNRGDASFGAVVARLSPRRTTIAALSCDELRHGGPAAQRCLAQLAQSDAFSPPDAFVLHINAVMTASGQALAELREHYRRELLET